ncbi:MULTISPECIES: hypothetical protein [Nitrosomonas]|uniref:hypothetical protein n=1 Tax=Nitrosomonas TaxID=914 RepID=UPI000ADA992A|nr:MULTISPECIES: hypothetical protein [Nitrosomonas]UVS61777.1 hypothetical protein NX761_01105 [Nitrosomonas sp. PLL12]
MRLTTFVKSLSRGGSSTCRNYRWDGVGKEGRDLREVMADHDGISSVGLTGI